MTHKEQFVAMLDDAGIDYGYSQGDSIISNGCRLRFTINGSLKEIKSEDGSDYDEDY